jgi:hypothetical protein
MKHLLPTFLIIGPPKTATSSLFETLSQHSAIAPPAKKEMHFFQPDMHFKRGLDWYASCFPLAQDNPGKSTFEASPSYFSFIAVPERIVASLGKIKLICVLRNPVLRFVSAYKHYRAVNYISTTPDVLRKFGEEHPWRKDETWTGIPESITEVLLRFQKQNEDTAHLFSDGCYAEHLSRWFYYFGRENVLCLFFEELVQYPQRVVQEVQSFLNLPIEDLAFRFENRSNVRTDFCPDQSIFEFQDYHLKILQDYYAPHNEALLALLGRTPGWGNS